MKEISVAKITAPSASGIHRRARLFRLLDLGGRHPITWISGPPGSGKTSLTTSYLEARRHSCIWYQVDERDADPGTFFYFMGLAARKAFPEKRKPLPLFRSEYRSGTAGFTKSFFEHLFFRFTHPVTIVLDNYQDLAADSDFHEVTRCALETVPPGIRIFILSRNEPPAALARPCANDRVFFVRWDDLRFTPRESEEMVRRKLKRKLTPEILEELYKKTDGWAAGLMLIIVGSRIPRAEGRLTITFATREVYEYFAREIFDILPQEVREFLLKTAFLPRVTVRIAEKLTGTDVSRSILDELSQNHYFTERYPAEETVYLYHPLFREFLLNRAEACFLPEEIRSIRRTSGELLQDSDWSDDAPGLFRDAGEWEGLTRLILSRAGFLIDQGRNRTVMKWAEMIPPEIRRNTPWLTYWMGVAEQPFTPSKSRSRFEESFHLFQTQNDEKGMLSAWAEIVDCLLVEANDYAALDPLIAWLIKRGRKGCSFPSRQIETRVTSAMTGALVWRQPWRRDVQKWVERSMILCREVGHRNLHLLTCISVVNYFAWSGNLEKCAVIAEEIRRAAKAPGASVLILLTWKWIEALLFNRTAKSNDLAHGSISEGLEIARKTGVHVWDHMFYAQGVYASFNNGEMDKAREFLRELEMALLKDRPDGHFQFQYLSGWYYLLNGDLSQALRCAENSRLFAEKTGVYFYLVQCRILLAQVLYEKHAYQAAKPHLSRAKELIRKSKSLLLEYMILMKEAQFALEQGQEALGLRSLRQAMFLGKREGYAKLFPWWQPSAIAGLCVRALLEGIETDYVTALIREHHLAPDIPPLDVESWPWPLKIYLLGKFEIVRNGRVVQFSRKVQKKPLAMLKILIAGGGKTAKEVQISDLLWPEADGDAAHNTFRSNLSRLRQILKMENAITFQEGKVWLDPRCCWIDAWAFEKKFEKFENEAFAGRRNAESRPMQRPLSHSRKESLMNAAESAITLYRGHFLTYEEDSPWAAPYRDRLREKFLRIVTRLGECLRESGEWEKALEIYRNALEVEDQREELYQEIMKTCQHLGQHHEAREIYARCRDTLSASLGIEPSMRTEEIFRVSRV